MAAKDDLLSEIFDGKRTALYREFEDWLRASRRFQDFATVHRSKIRSKLRQAPTVERMLDVRAELEAAYLLLTDRRFVLEYEAYAALKQRGPDFTVTYRRNTRLNVEVRRLRSGVDVGESQPDGEGQRAKLMAVLLEKARQMPPSIANLLWLATQQAIPVSEVAEATAMLRQMAERRDEPFFMRRGFASAAGYLKQFSRMSGIVVWDGQSAAVWANAGARHPLAGEIVRAVEAVGRS